MASNTIKFNNGSISLNGVMIDKERVSYCKGIKFNGTSVVSFDATAGILNWQEYTNDYNAVWNSNESEIYSRRLSKATMENEFAITRSKWLLFNKASMFDEVGVTDRRLFNLNADGKLYVGDDTLVDNWQKIKDNGSFSKFTIAVNPYLDLKKQLTGLPLLYKRIGQDDSTLEFNTTGIVGATHRDSDGNLNFDVIGIGEIINYQGEALTTNDIVSAINEKLGSSRATASADVITIAGTDKWDQQGLCDFLSNVYIDGFGPYGQVYEGMDDSGNGLDQGTYYLLPNTSFHPSKHEAYWGVDPNYMLPIEIKYVTYDQGCDFYILTAWGESQVPSAVDLSSGYSMQGENNALVNVLYFDTSSLAGLKYPNILVEMNTIFNTAVPEILYTNGDSSNPIWESIADGVGYVFPSDCPYDLNSNTDIVAPQITVSEWSSLNNFKSVTWEIDQSVEPGYGVDWLAPAEVAIDIFNWYEESFPDQFPSGTGNSSGNIGNFKLKLKLRAYSADANIGSIYSDITTDTYTAYWYLNAYDPYNVGGYYPVAKTTTTNAGTMWKSEVN